MFRSDKHPAYEILNGPSGTGVQDLFTPEINSDAPAGGDWTDVNSSTRQYDGYKVQAVLNEIAGLDHSGRQHVGSPAIYGMNFQSVSTAQKLPGSDGEIGGYAAGGYAADGSTPGPLLQGALRFVDTSLGQIAALQKHGEYDTTTIILSAKHGQSAMDGGSLARIDDGAIIDALNAAWQRQHPDAPQPLVAASMDDDGMLLWFSNGRGTDGQAKATDLTKGPNAYTQAGLKAIYAGPAAAQMIGVPTTDERVPDLIGVGAARRRLHRQDSQDRRARWRRPTGPRRPPRGRRPGDHPRHAPRVRRDDADRTHDPRAARPQPG